MLSPLDTRYAVFWASCLATHQGPSVVHEVNLTFGLPDVDRGMLQRTQLTQYSKYGEIDRADVVWTGSEYGIALVSGKKGGGGYLLRVSKHGQVLSQTRVSDTNTVNYSLVVGWHGDGYGLAWVSEEANGRALNYLRTDSSGVAMGTRSLLRHIGRPSTELIKDQRSRPAIAWSGGSYVLAWHDFRDSPPPAAPADIDAAHRDHPEAASLDWERRSSTYIVSISKEGDPLGSSTRLASGTRMEDPVMTWTGSEYGIVSVAANEVTFTRVRPGGQPRSELLAIQHAPQGVYSAVFDPYRLFANSSSYGLTWISSPGDIYYMGLSPGCDDGRAVQH